MENSAFLQQNYLIIIALLFIVGGIGLFLYSFKKEQPEQDHHAIHNGGHTTSDEVNQRYKKIINNAHNEARAILDSTSVTSASIIADSKATNEHLSENLDKILQKIAQEHITHLKSTSEEFSKSYDERLASLQVELKTHTEQSIKESEARISQALEKYLEPLAAKAAQTNDSIDHRTQELTAQVEKELADYKAAHMAKIEADVQELIMKTYRDVLRKSIPDSLQEELIIESLEKAKKEGGILI